MQIIFFLFIALTTNAFNIFCINDEDCCFFKNCCTNHHLCGKCPESTPITASMNSTKPITNYSIPTMRCVAVLKMNVPTTTTIYLENISQRFNNIYLYVCFI